jgi:HlyD family secretion protein
MTSRTITVFGLAVLGVPALIVGYQFLHTGRAPPEPLLATVTCREIKMVVDTNGTIEPVERGDILAPIDAFVAGLRVREGSEVTQGQLLMQLESKQILTALAQARASLSQAKRDAQVVVAGPSKEELAAVEAAIAESELQLQQAREDLRNEEALLQKQATTRATVDALRKQVDLLELRFEAVKRRRQALLSRYSTDDRQWERDRISELTKEVELLDQQVRLGAIVAPRTGSLYSLSVSPGSYVTRGQLLAHVYAPGAVALRAYVDEPDLGRVQRGQQTLITWDGLPDRQWTGVVDVPAKQVVALGNRSVGHVLCSIDGAPRELIPNINVKVQIVTASKAAALVVPRAAVFNSSGRPTVLVFDGARSTQAAVRLGLVTPEEIEIIEGIGEGTRVVVNPAEAGAR